MKKTRVAHPQMMKTDWSRRRRMYWVMGFSGSRVEGRGALRVVWDVVWFQDVVDLVLADRSGRMGADAIQESANESADSGALLDQRVKPLTVEESAAVGKVELGFEFAERAVGDGQE